MYQYYYYNILLLIIHPPPSTTFLQPRPFQTDKPKRTLPWAGDNLRGDKFPGHGSGNGTQRKAGGRGPGFRWAAAPCADHAGLLTPGPRAAGLGEEPQGRGAGRGCHRHHNARGGAADTVAMSVPHSQIAPTPRHRWWAFRATTLSSPRTHPTERHPNTQHDGLRHEWGGGAVQQPWRGPADPWVVVTGCCSTRKASPASSSAGNGTAASGPAPGHFALRPPGCRNTVAGVGRCRGPGGFDLPPPGPRRGTVLRIGHGHGGHQRHTWETGAYSSGGCGPVLSQARAKRKRRQKKTGNFLLNSQLLISLIPPGFC